MQSEKEYMLTQFKANFSDMSGKKLAIYGLGPNTEALLEVYGNTQPVVALMDGMRIGETVWGLPVVTCDEASAMGVEAIIILARASNLAIIYRRIEADCERLGMPVYDINGRRIEKPDEKTRQIALEFYKQHGEKQLREKIDSCDVISFDIFDTLLMRKVLYPEDIFALVERKANRLGLLAEEASFVRQRQSAERELYLHGQPRIQDIYSLLVKRGALDEIQADKLMEMELQAEMEHILPRQSMLSMLTYAKEAGKTVCCTSDMYLSSAILARILRRCQIEADEILVSCEHGCHKGNGLFDILKGHYPGQRILHIGDNEDADIRSAQRYGIAETFPVHSAMKMLEDSPAAEMLKCVKGLEDHLEAGRFMAKYLQDPFLFERTEGKLEISSAYDMGYYFLEPMMEAFLQWLVERCKDQKIDMLLLGARDGWMMTRLLDIYSQRHELLFEYRYIPASRTACTVAGVRTAEDVEFAASQAFSGTAEEMLEKRFLLSEEELLPRGGKEDKAYILSHQAIILEKAKRHRRNYLELLASMGIKAGQKKAYFDFVSSGSCQLWLEKILGEKLQGYCYARFVLPGKEQLDMEAFLTEVFPMQGDTGCHVLENYLFVESLISATESFLLNVEQGGNLRYAEEQRSEESLAQIKAVQEGISVRFTAKMNEAPMSKDLADFIAGALQKKCAFLSEGSPKDRLLVDEFCNREFKMSSFL